MFGKKSYHILNVRWGELVSVIMTAASVSTQTLHLALSTGRSSASRITPSLWKPPKQQTSRREICKTREDQRLSLILLLNLYDLMQCFKKYVCPQRAVAVLFVTFPETAIKPLNSDSRKLQRHQHLTYNVNRAVKTDLKVKCNVCYIRNQQYSINYGFFQPLDQMHTEIINK